MIESSRFPICGLLRNLRMLLVHQNDGKTRISLMLDAQWRGLADSSQIEGQYEKGALIVLLQICPQISPIYADADLRRLGTETSLR